MKKLVLMMLTSLPAIAFAQGGKYVVEGTLGTYSSPAKVYLQYRNKKQMFLDSAAIDNGAFKFEGTLVDDPIMATLIFNPRGTGPSGTISKQVYLENGTITVNGADSLVKITIDGTQSNVDNRKLDSAMAVMNPAYDALATKRNGASDEVRQTDEYLKQAGKLEKDIQLQRAAIDKKFMQDNPDSYISLVVLGSYAYSADYADIAPLFNGMSDRMKQTVRGRHFAERLPHLKAVALGATAPEFAAADTSGIPVNLSSFRGKYVLVDFWASWCGPCRQENPKVVKAFNRYKSQNFTILGVSLDSPTGKDRWLAAIRKDGLAWTQVSDLKYWDSDIAALYAVNAIPQNFLLDPNGKIIAKNLRGEDLENKLEELFGKI